MGPLGHARDLTIQGGMSRSWQAICVTWLRFTAGAAIKATTACAFMSAWPRMIALKCSGWAAAGMCLRTSPWINESGWSRAAVLPGSLGMHCDDRTTRRHQAGCAIMGLFVELRLIM